MRKIKLTAFILALSVALAGCTQALLFNNGVFLHTVEPLTLNQNATDVRESLLRGRGSITQVSDPLISGLSVRLGKNGLGDIAKRHGIETIYYADLEEWSCCLGLWSRDVVHIYGK